MIMKTEETNSVLVFGTSWCPGCHLAKAILEGANVDYEFVNIDAHAESAEKVMAMNGGKRLVPTIVIGEDIYSNPSYDELVAALNDHGLLKLAS